MAQNKASESKRHELICQHGESLATLLGIPLTELRYAKYTLHDGRQWTITARWEKLEYEQWIEIDWVEFIGH